jgi:arylsulfatase A
MIRFYALSLATVLCLAACGVPNAPEAVTNDVAVQERAQPNIVVLFADDMGYGDLGSYGHPYNRTPNLDTLAAEGQRWTDFYVAASVCSPSRGALLTGRLPVRTGIYGKQIGVYFPGDPGGMPAQEVTLAEALQQVGYRTGIFGKWHLGDAKHAWPTRHGFDEWLGLPYSNDMDWVDELGIDELRRLREQGKLAELGASLANRPAKYADPKNEYWAVPLLHSTVRGDEYADEVVEQPVQQSTLTTRYTEAAINFMRAAGDQPFFAYVPYSMPHTPLFRSAEFAGKSLGGRYGDVIEEIDWSVGQIKQALLDLGVADNTLVIFSSDNGPWLTMKTQGGRAGLLRHGKGTTFEGGMRVPTVFWWPNRLNTGVVSGIGSTLDIFATVAALSGANGTTAVDGLDLSPVLFSDQPSPRKQMAYYRGDSLYAYRMGPWKAHFISEGRYGQPPEKTTHETPLLFHLRDDPSERFDVSEENPGIVEEILQAVVQHKAGLQVAPPEFDRRLVQ